MRGAPRPRTRARGRSALLACMRRALASKAAAVQRAPQALLTETFGQHEHLRGYFSMNISEAIFKCFAKFKIVVVSFMHVTVRRPALLVSSLLGRSTICLRDFRLGRSPFFYAHAGKQAV